MTPDELMALAKQLQALGASVKVDPEELEGYFPEVESERDFYLPRVPKNFYYDAEKLRSLSRVDSSVFRRMLGIKET